MRRLLCSVLFLAVSHGRALADDVDFTRDVRPILSRHCFKCHGPDDKARKADLRLDIKEDALRGGSSGEPAFVPGQPDVSELVRRIFTDDEGEVMPPPSANLALTGIDQTIDCEGLMLNVQGILHDKSLDEKIERRRNREALAAKIRSILSAGIDV